MHLQERLKAVCSELWISDFVRKISAIYTTQIVLILIGLATNVAVARILGPAGRGLYAVTLAIGQIGMQFGQLGLPAANTYFLGRDRTLLSPLVGNCAVVSLCVFAACSSLAALIFSIDHNLAPTHGFLLVAGFIYIPLGLNFLLLENLLLALQQVGSFNRLELTNRILMLIMISSIIIVHWVTPQIIFSANLFVLILSNISALLQLRPFLHAAPRPSIKLFCQHFGLGFRAYLILLFGYLLLRVDLLMTKYFLGAAAAGYYSIAASMADYVLMLPGAIAMVLFPKLSAMRDGMKRFEATRKAVVGFIFMFIPLLCIAGLSASMAVRIMFGKAFSPAAGAFIWLLPGICCMGIQTVAVQVLNAMGYPTSVIWIWIVSVVLNVIGNLWMIPHMGIAGASLMSTISYSLTMAGILVVIVKMRKDLSASYAF